MKKHYSISSLALLCVLVAAGCDDESTSSSSPNSCNPQCSPTETCVEGVCQCGDEVCASDEKCVSNKCQKEDCTGEDCNKPEDCTGEDCNKPEDCTGEDCNKPEDCTGEDCNKPEDCTGEDCNKPEDCTGEDCNKPEDCTGEDCNKPEDCTGEDCKTPDECNGACNESEKCVEGVCQCGDRVCEDSEVCRDNKCEPANPNSSESDDTEEEDENNTCEITCQEGTECLGGECVPKAIECNPQCDAETEYCDEAGQCQPRVKVCLDCAEGESCVDGKCMCGQSTCSEDEICSNSTCTPIDPCAKKQCSAGQICENGTCKTVKLSFNTKSMDVMLSSVSNKLVATKSTDADLIWTIDGKAANVAMSNIQCLVSTKDGVNTYSTKPNECIKVDKTKKTETIQFISVIRHPKAVKVTVKTADGTADAEATLNFKPYFDMDSFDKISALVYRNGYCAGHKLVKDIAKYDYADHADSESAQKANLGGIKTSYGPANPYAKATFTEEEKAIFDKDMYTKYIRPHMYKVGSEYYATRASVVAAARFLILQFPYDIPYQMISLSNTVKARSHYVQTLWRDKASDISKTRIFGLNLTSNVYNSSLNRDEKTNIIRTTAIPWGAAYDSTSNEKYPYNGLECSGFVTWAFNNGRLTLGDWKTKMFAKTGECDYNKDGKIDRNYKCEELVNKSGESWTNRNNNLFYAHAKLNKLEEKDFIQLNGLSTSDINKKFKDAKAGDLLWKGTWTDQKNGKYKGGHIAMIIGIKRNKTTKDIEAIEVGEAVYRAGNKLTKYTVSSFKDSGWVTNNTQISFLIKMDNVYNYYLKNHPIEDKPEDVYSDCPNAADKLTGNCYKYTDMYNEKFNDAIKNKTW